MKPTREVEHTLVDLVDAILNKGVVVNADVIISLAGVPLIGVNLRAAIAGMETMLKYGMMEAWDEKVRREYAREIAEMNTPPLADGEKVILHTFGSHYYCEGIYNAWRPGDLYLTERRLFLFRKGSRETLFEAPLKEIEGLSMTKDEYFVDAPRERLLIRMKSGEIARLNSGDLRELKEAIERRVGEMGRSLDEVSPPRQALWFLEEDEVVVQAEKMWYQEPASEISSATWRPGWMYVTNKRVCWSYDSYEELSFEAPIRGVTGIAIERRSTVNTSFGMDKMVLVLAYTAVGGEGRTLFAGREEKLRGLKEAVEKELALVA